jgi:Tol biopolymer transport system component
MKKLNFLILILSLIFIYAGCGEDNGTGPPGSVIKSDLTRTGKFISFTSNLTGNYNIYLAQVESDGSLSTSGLVYPTNPFNLTTLFVGVTNKQSNWSPDGRMLVFTTTQGNSEDIFVFFFKADGSIDSSITPNPKQLIISGGNWDNNASFSPDGKYLIWDRRYDNANPPGVDTADSRDLYIGDVVDSGANMQITNIHAVMTTLVADEFNPKWSPRISVRRVAYESRGSIGLDHNVWIIDPLESTNNVKFYEPNKSGYPAWSPACDNIVFESDKSPGGFWKIVSLGYPTNNNTPTDIAAESNVHLRYPTWLPNGSLLAYIRIENGLGNIWIIPAGGGASFKLLASVPQFNGVNNLWPAW